VANYLAEEGAGAPDPDGPIFKEAIDQVRERVAGYLSSGGKRSSRSYHKELGHIMWEFAGMARNASGLQKAIGLIQDLKEDFSQNLTVPGKGEHLNAELERASRTEDFLDFGELLCRDALERDESCGGHFREEHQTAEGEALRDDENFSHAAVWEHSGQGKEPTRHKEDLHFENVKLAVRSYK
jgi:succinate dehydrogenase / fumarate reductase flavoprotein subunit